MTTYKVKYVQIFIFYFFFKFEIIFIYNLQRLEPDRTTSCDLLPEYGDPQLIKSQIKATFLNCIWKTLLKMGQVLWTGFDAL